MRQKNVSAAFNYSGVESFQFLTPVLHGLVTACCSLHQEAGGRGWGRRRLPKSKVVFV